MDKIKILFLAANPTDTSHLRLGEEVSAIDQELLSARYRDKFDLKQQHAVKAKKLSQHLLRYEPDIVHFSGHGSRAGQIYFEDATGKSHPASPRALTNLFSLFKDNIRCVVLNACYSVIQAESIVNNIDCVIGMSKAIGDDAAINFAQGFYRGIGWGKDLEFAFKLGCSEIDINNLNEQDTPKIRWKNDQTQSIIFSQMAKSVSNSVVSYMNYLDQIYDQLVMYLDNGQKYSGPKGEKLERHGSDIVGRYDGYEMKRITADKLKDLPKSEYEYIKSLEERMEKQFQKWKRFYPQRDFSLVPSENERVEQQLKGIVSNIKDDFNGITSFLNRLGFWLDDHYMHIRDLLDRFS